MKISHNIIRLERAFMASHLPKGAPFSNRSTLTKVFKAPADLFQFAREHVTELVGPYKKTSVLDSVLQRVRRMQNRG